MSIGAPFVGLTGSGDSHGSDSLTSSPDSPGFCATTLLFPLPTVVERPPIAANTIPATTSTPIAMIAANCFCCACRDFFPLGFDFDFRNELAVSISTCDGRELGADSGSANAPNGLSFAADAAGAGIAGAEAAGTNGGGAGAGCGGAIIGGGAYCGAP